MTATGVYRAACSVESWGDAPFRDVTFRDVSVEFEGGQRPASISGPVKAPGVDARPLPAWGLYARNVERLTLEDVRLDHDVFEVTQAVERLDVLAHNFGRIGVAHAGLELETDGGLFDLPRAHDVDLRHERLVLSPDPARQEEGQETKPQEWNVWNRSERRHGRGQGLMKGHILRVKPHREKR